MKKQKFLEEPFYILSSLLVAIILGTALMIAVYHLPTGVMREHVLESIEIYDEIEDFPAWAPGLVYSITDNTTDSIMVNTAIFKGTDSAVNDAMNNPYIRYEKAEDFSDSLVMVAKGEKGKSWVVDYARYWHGYLLWLKPALSLFSLSGVKTINAFVQIFLMIMVVLKLAQRLSEKHALAFAATICLLNPITTAMCFQYSAIYYILLVAMLVILKQYGPENADKSWKLFLWVGIAVAFFDFLTYPMVALGIPLILVLLLGQFEWKKGIVEIIKDSFCWGVGYAGMWMGKWLVSSLVTGVNVFADGFASVSNRISGEVPDVEEKGSWLSGVIASVRGNLSALNNEPIWLLIIAIIAIIVIALVRKGYKLVIDKKVIPLLVVTLFPFAWYIVLANHSRIHIFMAYRELAITCFALLCVVAECLVKREAKD